jgi:hypothetical protein
MSDWKQFWRWFFHVPDPEPVVGITKALRRDLDALPPGQSLKLTAQDGARVTIMQSDDFEHVTKLAGLVERPAHEPVMHAGSEGERR